MAELVVGIIMDKLINTCFEYFQDQVIWQRGMKEVLERLQKLHPMIQSVIFAYNQAHIRDQNPALNKWLWHLRDAIDEADDVLDEFEYIKHEEKLTKNNENTKVRSATNFLFERARKILKVGERALKIDPNLKRLEEAVKNLDKVSAEVVTFLHILESTKQEQHLELCKTRESGSLPKHDQIGRGKEKESVMQWLRKTSSERQTHITSTALYNNISLLSIVGHGGMGKTTFLQHVYEDERTKEFDLKMWVCVSTNFDAKRVIADMLESLKKERPHLESLHTLQESLKSEVMSKTFLLVLDDIWEEREEQEKTKWENVLVPLAYGGFGSKILITTRMDSVALMIAKVIKKKKEILRLEGLEEEDCLELLNNHAFADVENLEDHKKLYFITKEIVKKLSGSPLAAKVMGGVLNSSLDERHWKKVLEADIGSAELAQNDILSILRLSYIILPKHLQKCFSFCCIFPQDHLFDKDDLVRMWIALGFIQPSYIQEETLEDIGGTYFDVLVNKSFFDKFGTKYYKMHELLHELAQSVSIGECFRVVGDDELLFRNPETIRHLSVETSNLEVLRKIEKFKRLRSLFLSYEDEFSLPYDADDYLYEIIETYFREIVAKIFKTCTSIRLLYIYAPYHKEIPEEIKYLIHLRYLKLDQLRVTQLPSSVSNLYHLQFIIYNERVESLPSNFLPRYMNNLSNLHYLKLPWNKFPGLHEIGNLYSLQELDGFYVKNEAGYRIGELEHMNELRQLRIKLLENVKDANEACSVKLCSKSKLVDLSLQWGHIRNIEDLYLDEKVLDNLEPHNNLKTLRIHAYMGVRSAIWMNNAYLISSLEYIKLDCCLEWQTLPPFGQLPFLKSLYLHNMPKVKRIDNKFQGNNKYCAFPSLKVLHIMKLEALEEWFDAAAVTDECIFPCLNILYLKDCPNLQELPSLPPKLKKLEINKIGWKGFNNCCSISRLVALRKLKIRNCYNLIYLNGLQEMENTENGQIMFNELVINDLSVLLIEPLRSITSIKKLTIKDNDELVSFPIEAEQWFLQVSSSLRELKFIRLKYMQSLPFSLPNLSSLKFLHVEDVPQLQLLPNIPTSLQRLELSRLKSLQCLPSFLSVSSLKYLFLGIIPQLRKLPDLPTSLEQLLIRYCHPELKERCRRAAGSDWHKIAHIPLVLPVSMSKASTM